VRKKFKWELLALLFVIVLVALIQITNPAEVIMSRMESLEYAGVFLVMFLSSATIILPVPGLAGVFIAGAFLNPILVGIAGGFGSALGELSGYFAGYGGKIVIEKSRRRTYKNIQRWMRRNGFITIFISAALPNPFFDMAGIAAGTLDYPLWEFLFACLAGKILKCIALAYLGRSLV